MKAVAANYTELEKALAEVPSDLSGYTEASVNILNDVLAKLDYNKNITEQDDVDAMVQAVYDAIAGLKQLADYSKVDEALAKANALDKTLYENYDVVEKAIRGVVRDKNTSEQAEVDKMAQDILDAISGLKYKLADYGKVDEAIEKANALNKNEYKDFSAVEAAIKAVIRDKDITEQAAVNAMAKAIEDAIVALEKKPIPTEPGQPSKPEQPSTEPSKDNPDAKATGTTNSPQTGDSGNPALWLALMGAGTIGLAGTALYHRKKKISR